MFPEHYLLTYGGPIAGTPEIWSNSLRFIQEPILAPPATFDYLSDVRGDVEAFIQNSDMHFGSAVVLGYVKFNRIDADGHYHDPTTTEYVYPDASIHGTSSYQFPLQDTIVATLHTGKRGQSNQGRMFLPPQGFAMANDYRITAAARDTMLTGVKTFLQDLGNWPGSDAFEPKVAVVSRTAGTGNAVTSVGMGLVVDTMRKRRSALVEDRAYQDVSQ